MHPRMCYGYLIMIKNDKDKFVIFEKCFAEERLLFNKAIILWDNDAHLQAVSIMKNTFSGIGLYELTRHLRNETRYPRNFDVLRKIYLDPYINTSYEKDNTN